MAYGGAAAGIIVALNEYAAGNMGVYEVTLIMLLIADFFVPMRLLTSYFHIAIQSKTLWNSTALITPSWSVF